MSVSTNLFTSDATGVTRPATADEILDAALTIIARRVRKGASLSGPWTSHGSEDRSGPHFDALSKASGLTPPR